MVELDLLDRLSNLIRVRYVLGVSHFAADQRIAYCSLYPTAAGTTVIAYDTLLTSSREIALIKQSKRWRLPTLLYLVNRYFAICFVSYYLSREFTVIIYGLPC